MANVTKPILLDETGLKIVEQLSHIAENYGNKNIAYLYDPLVAHAKDEYRIYNDELYKCTIPTPAGTQFSLTNWTRVRVMEELEHGGTGGAVSSVNGKTGAVLLNADDIPEGSVNQYITPTQKEKIDSVETIQATTIKDVHDYYVIDTVEGAFDQIGETLLGLAEALEALL